MNQTIPKVGQYLYATCLGDDYGKIVAVGKDENGCDTIDIEIKDPNLIIDCRDSQEAEGFGSNVLTTLEVTGGAKLILKNVQWQNAKANWAFMINCNTPGNLCSRCTKNFVVKDEPAKTYPSP